MHAQQCPLWVKSGLNGLASRCLLRATSGHRRFTERKSCKAYSQTVVFRSWRSRCK